MLPPPSLAVASGIMPEANAAVDPPLLPPGLSAGFQGLRVTPQAREAVIECSPNSGAAVLPTKTAPALRRRATCGASFVAGGPFLKSSDPCDEGMPVH